MEISRKPLLPGKGKSFRKDRKETEIKFSVKRRFEFLGGFQKRKEERRKKGNLINLKKEQKRKKDEATSYKQHVQAEYQKAVDAIVHNQGAITSVTPTAAEVLETAVTFYPAIESIDPFGEVSVQVSSLESPEFSRTYTGELPRPSTENHGEKVPSASSKKLPVYARYKQLTRSSKFLHRKRSEPRTGGLKRVKSSKKNGKKKSTR
jgi:hypothetical protein